MPPFGPATESEAWREFYRRRAAVPHCSPPYRKLDGTWHIPPCTWQPLTALQLAEAYAAGREYLATQREYHTPGAANRPPTRAELRRTGERAAAQAKKRRDQRQEQPSETRHEHRQVVLL